MSKTDLLKSKEHPTSAPVDLEFSLHGRNFKVSADLEVVAALASVPYEVCAKSTRDILKEIGVTLPAVDSEINIGETLANIPFDSSRSVLDPGYVFIVTSAISLNVLDTDCMTDVPMDDEIIEDIDDHLKESLVNHIICDGCCFTSDHLNKMLE